MVKFNVGDKAWIIETTISVNEVEIINIKSGFVALKFKGSSGEWELEKADSSKQKKKMKKWYFLIRKNKWYIDITK